MDDFQKHEIVACGYNVTSTKSSPNDHVIAMKQKLENIVLGLAGSEANEGK
jgi:Zn ribbon nucleic-acid-binding protein